ncbi:PIG-U domain containing protein [Pyrenophora tritici-repentis]|nr:GPI transamidase component PIG-U [Pyrenophora tritici-repentis]PZC97599.1 PIG-U domain containing protein [Pyrenophora tritici-repentis]PZD41696.1 PIG-U domain containing protein [Pyrenophora tritici-repentis]
MAIDTQQKMLLFGAAAAVRLLLFTVFPALPDLLAGRVEVSTPVTSFKRLQEGVFLHTHNVSPYDGGVFHQAPLLLPLFSLLPNPSRAPLATNILYTIVDLLSANALYQVAESGFSSVTRLFASPRKDLRWSSMAITAGFLFSPFTVLTCIARSTSSLTNLFILTAMAKASQGASFTFIFATAFASYFAMHPILLFPPLMVLLYDAKALKNKSTPNTTSFVVTHTLGFVVAIGALLAGSAFLTGSWDFLGATYGVRLLMPDLTPNVGLWWYFFIEMFDSFREFFLGVFWLHAASYMPGLTIRLHKQPLFVACALTGVFAIFTPYPSIADAALYLSLVPMFRHLFPLMRYTFLASASILYTSFLGPAFYHLWVYAGSGNANFFYAITLVWSLGMSIILGDSLYAALRDELDVERPELQGKEWLRVAYHISLVSVPLLFQLLQLTLFIQFSFNLQQQSHIRQTPNHIPPQHNIATMSNNVITFTPREMEVLALAWKCMETQPKVDMNKLASLTGYTPGSASVTFGKIKQKIRLVGDSLSSAGPAPPKNGSRAKATPSTTPRKRSMLSASTPPSAKKSKQREIKREPEMDFEEFGLCALDGGSGSRSAAVRSPGGNGGFLDGIEKYAWV